MEWINIEDVFIDPNNIGKPDFIIDHTWMCEMENITQLLKKLPIPKVEVIPDDIKDQKVAQQMSDILNWKIKESLPLDKKEGFR